MHIQDGTRKLVWVLEIGPECVLQPTNAAHNGCFHTFGMTLENWPDNWKSIRSMCYNPWKRPKHIKHLKNVIYYESVHIRDGTRKLVRVQEIGPGRPKIVRSAGNRSRVCAIAHENRPKSTFSHWMALENWPDCWKSVRSVWCKSWKVQPRQLVTIVTLIRVTWVDQTWSFFFLVKLELIWQFGAIAIWQ